jgi:iron-sulfur cluster assembly protein
MITITNTAKEKLFDIMNNEKIDTSKFLRVGVKGGGCSGLSYQMDFDDTIRDGDEVFEDNGIKIVCDMKSLLYLFGTELNYSGGLNGKGFEWINPNAERVCGCGISFSV